MSLPPSPTVFVVDDDAAIRKAVSRLLRSAGIAVTVFESPREFLAQYDPNTPGCLVLDLAMPGFNGLQLQTVLGERGSILPIIFLSGHGDVSKSVQAMKGGAFDFLTKPVNAKNLLPAIRAAIERGAVARREQAELSEIRARLDTLTPREREVLEHVATGKLNKQVAGDLGITEATVKMHRARVIAKMKVQSVAELARLTERCGIRGTNSLKSAA
ncbi:MAG: DNA-binding response regulator [Verrucomicrobia bacterium]|nr:MAG: DNA-binding response regulator [Verrucomicrobiota bacterium]PYK43917.1 MAG: DNA-binding response regulator [Verrucomicrobiota bacterium]